MKRSMDELIEALGQAKKDIEKLEAHYEAESKKSCNSCKFFVKIGGHVTGRYCKKYRDAWDRGLLSEPDFTEIFYADFVCKSWEKQWLV